MVEGIILVLFLFILVWVILFFIRIEIKDKKKEKERKEKRINLLDNKLKEIPNQDRLKIIRGRKSRYAFVLDEVGRVIYFIKSSQITKVPFDQIISVELIEDNTLLSSKSTTRTIGGALLGGALAGGAGMVVGGLSGDSMQKKKVSKITVKIKLRDYSTPALLIPCFIARELTGLNEIEITDKNSEHFYSYKNELQNAQKISDYVSVIIDEVDRQEKQSHIEQSTSIEKSSVADELAKLASLKEQGILTDEEFKVQKEKLLNM